MTSQVHRALPAVLVVPPVVQPAVGHSSALTPPGGRGFAPIGVLEKWSTGVMGELVLNNVKERNTKTIFPAFAVH